MIMIFDYISLYINIKLLHSIINEDISNRGVGNDRKFFKRYC